MRTAFGLRFLIALTLTAWGQFAFAEDYYWVGNDNNRYSSPSSACAASNGQAVNGYAQSTFRFTKLEFQSELSFFCLGDAIGTDGTKQNGSNDVLFGNARRGGDSCPSGATYNSQTGECVGSKDCSDTAGKEVTKALICTYNAQLKTAVCPTREVSVDGCTYIIGSGKASCVSDIATGQYICTRQYIGTGEEDGTGAEPCDDETCAGPTDPNAPEAEDQCVTNGNLTICHSQQEEGCGTVNGKSGCFQEEAGCGYFNGTYQCTDTSKDNRNCGYYNGKQTCFDPKDPTKIIPETSSDHPKNGGNADGDDTNDPLPSGAIGGGTEGSSQGSDQGATNESIEGLGDKLSKKLDELGKGLDDLKDGLLGAEYDGSGSGEGQGIGDAAGEAGGGLAGSFGDALEGVLQAQGDSDKGALDAFPSIVNDPNVGWFGPDSAAYKAVFYFDGWLPRPVACGIQRINIPSMMGYNLSFSIDSCPLAFLKPLLEWIIWCLVVIGVWRIAYATLRLENAKAEKGGF